MEWHDKQQIIHRDIQQFAQMITLIWDAWPDPET
jgi:hypothetical protein